MADYDEYTRARILYNHLVDAKPPVEAMRTMGEAGVFRAICSHPNFSPRVIEVSIDSWDTLGTQTADLSDLILAAFDDPIMLWRHVFERQFGALTRWVLFTLVTFPRETSFDSLAQCLASLRPDAFFGADGRRLLNSELARLDGAFTYIDTGANTVAVGLSNPSVRDFLINELARSPESLQELIRSAPTFSQLMFLASFVFRHLDWGSSYNERLSRTLSPLWPELFRALCQSAVTEERVIVRHPSTRMRPHQIRTGYRHHIDSLQSLLEQVAPGDPSCLDSIVNFLLRQNLDSRDERRFGVSFLADVGSSSWWSPLLIQEYRERLIEACFGHDQSLEDCIILLDCVDRIAEGCGAPRWLMMVSPPKVMTSSRTRGGAS